MIRKEVKLSDEAVKKLEAEAKREKRTLKNHMEYILEKRAEALSND